jgi:hypothetical protein
MEPYPFFIAEIADLADGIIKPGAGGRTFFSPMPMIPATLVME